MSLLTKSLSYKHTFNSFYLKFFQYNLISSTSKIKVEITGEKSSNYKINQKITLLHKVM